MRQQAFGIDIDEKKAYAVFKVYTTRIGMRRALAKVHHPTNSNVFGSCLHSIDFSQKVGIPGGHIFLNEEDLGSGKVAHEIYHLVEHILNEFDGVKDGETGAYLMQDTTTMFWDWWLE